jgi:CRP/FNR family transcriptional regulator, cyclic AMP receptor protein
VTVATGIEFAAMARYAYLDQLARVPLFSACTKKELQAVARASDEVSIAEGRTLCEQGSVGREAFVIVDGEAEVRRNGRKVATLGAGDCVGELALLDHGPRTATVTASTDLTVLVLGVREFAGILDEVPSIAHKLMKALAGRIRELDAKAFG